MICRFFLDRGISQQTHIQCVGKGFGVLCIQATAVIAERVLNVLSEFQELLPRSTPRVGATTRCSLGSTSLCRSWGSARIHQTPSVDSFTSPYSSMNFAQPMSSKASRVPQSEHT